MSEQSFESSYKRLEEIVKLLQNDELNIDDSIALFKEGIELKKVCDNILKSANEQVVEIMNENDIGEIDND